ncbi:MAG TPA: BamA/TamA family outer membrane protein [Polyangiaceae bacterium]|jgi:outer membrane protein insertion porin family/translocation and assembly module TamA|nr:BamA/TamA family outer membrane protein [Polyangiaceae bacterium]
MSLFACTHAPEQLFSLNSVTVTGNQALSDDEIEDKLASRETPRFLGLFPGVIYEHQRFNRYVLERDLQRVERLYRARGYYEAHARAARVVRDGNVVRVEIVVEEGRPVLVRRIDVHGVEPLPEPLRERSLSKVHDALKLAEPFDEDRFDTARSELETLLKDETYARAKVTRVAEVDLPAHSASVGFWIEPGPKCEFGELSLRGVGDLPTAVILRTLAVERGDPYSDAELQEARRALLELGVFSSVTITPEFERSVQTPQGRTQIPLQVTVERAKLRSVHVGGGFQLDTLKSELHVSAGWQDSNFLGGLRQLQIEAVPGVILYPTRVPNFESPERLLPEGRIHAEFRQPNLIAKRLNGLLKAQLSIQPSLLSSQHGSGEPILGYRDYRAAAGLDRSLGRWYAMLTENVQTNVPFAYRGELGAGLGSVLITYPALFVALDLRNDRIEPRRGLYTALQVEAAGLIGDAQDLKLMPEVRGYVPLARHTVLASRLGLGLLFPRNYGATVRPNAMTGQSGLSGSAQDVQSAWVRDLQLMFFRGLFAGGSGSNRGYGLREIGPHGVVPYYIPGRAADTLAMGCPASGTQAGVACDLPLGGFTLWEASVELRQALLGPLSAALFVDMADVAASELLLRWRPHLSVGLGLRYDTPVGPIRLDAGYRVPGLQAPAGAPDEGTPTRLFGLPMAASFGIGEPF